MESSTEITCPGCGGSVRVDGTASEITCPYCGASFVREQKQDGIDADDYFTAYYRDLDTKQTEGVDWLRKKELLSSLSRFEESLTFFLKKVGNNAMPHIGKLTFLRELDLYSCKITNKGLSYVGGMKNIRILNLEDTKITGSGLQYLKGLNSLEELNLEKTKVDDEGMEYLAGCTALKKINVDFTKVTEAGLVNLKDLPHLDTVKISEYNIKPGPVFRAGMARVIRDFMTLNFSGYDLMDEELEPAGLFTELIDITLDGNNIRGPGMKYLTGLRNLQGISLNNTPFTDGGLEILGACKNLGRIMLFNTNVTEKAVRHFEKSHPKIQMGVIF